MPAAAPDPPSLKNVPVELIDYLRRLRVWAMAAINDRMISDTANPYLLLLPDDQKPPTTAYRVTVHGGYLTLTQVPPGALGAVPSGGSAGASMTLAPVTKYGSSINANPAGTTSATYVMMGMNLIISPEIATAAWITADGQITNSANNGETDVVVCYGTGAAPVNGAAQAGTILGQPSRYKATAANDFVPFSLTSLATGLVNGTTYWIDLAVKAVGGGTARVMDLNFSAHGLA
jgi:hypothetical protein